MKSLKALINKDKINKFSVQDYLYVLYPYTIKGCNEIDKYIAEYSFVLKNNTTCFICTKRKLKELDREVLTPKSIEYRLYITKNIINRDKLEDKLYQVGVVNSPDLEYVGDDCIHKI